MWFLGELNSFNGSIYLFNSLGSQGRGRLRDWHVEEEMFSRFFY